MASINGFTVVNYGDKTLGTYKVPGTDVALSVRKEIAPLLLEFARWFHVNIEPLRRGACWGHAYRNVRGSSTRPSFHAAGIAIDLNADIHVLGKRGTYLPKAKVAKIQAKARALGLRWGGDYTKRADEMHFELIVPRDKALELVTRLQSPPTPRVTVAARPPALMRTVISLTGAIASFKVSGKNWADVAPIQRALVAEGLLQARTVDAIPGPKTKAAYAAWQRRLGYAGKDADGMPGSKSLAALGRKHGFAVSG